MRHFGRACHGILVLMAVAWLCSQSVYAQIQQGRVIAVASAEAFDLQLESGEVSIVRLAGVSQSEALDADAGREALRALIQGRQVRVTYKGVDARGRRLGKAILLDDGRDVANTLLSAGVVQADRSVLSAPMQRAQQRDAEELSRDQALERAARSEPPSPHAARSLNGFFEEKMKQEPASYEGLNTSMVGVRGNVPQPRYQGLSPAWPQSAYSYYYYRNRYRYRYRYYP